MTPLEGKAGELGRMIGQSAEYQAVKRTTDAIGNDREAAALVRTLDKLRSDAQSLIERGEQPTPDMERQLEELLDKVQSNSVYQSALVAQENFDKLMLRVNEWILGGIQKGSTSPIITLG